MATTEDALISDLARDSEKATYPHKVAITGMAFALGSKKINIEDKVQTIRKTDSKGRMLNEKVDPVDELDKAFIGLGVESSSVAGVGEDIITGGARAILNLCFLYNLNLSDVKTFVFATESPEDISRNHAVEIVRIVNKISAELLKRGIDIGELDTKNSTNSQSACVAGVASLSDMAFRGVVGKALIVTSDDAKYQLGSGPDETGGYGATAVLVEDAKAAKGGIRVSSDILGHYTRSVPDFLKPILDVLNESRGIAIVNKYPIVFGEYSEYVYILDTYRAMKKAFEQQEGKSIEDLTAIKDSHVLISHTPYPKMPAKALSYLVRHFAHNDKSTELKLALEMKDAKEPFLEGFEGLEKTIKFIVDVEGYYVHLSGIIEAKERLAGTLKDEVMQEVERELSSKVGRMASMLMKELESIKEKYNLKGKLLATANTAIMDLSNIQTGSSTVEDVRKAFNGIHSIVKEHIREDKKYTKAIRGTSAFKDLAKSMHIEDTIVYSSKVGNIYTGSSFLALMSYLANSGPYKKIGFSGFGSGSQSHYTEMEACDADYIASRIRKNAEVEFGSQEKIDAKRYESIRCARNLTDEELARENSIIRRLSGFEEVDYNRLVAHAEKLRDPLKISARGDATTRRLVKT
ncbi:MAG: hypothetical protein KGH59_03705 [Candidatus Micrarchaeota archaeon]|nr:hypothetical protein [Candidatus Micrarchaeota archaeon]MDE1847121.1 hypothetical protein [Candidatus Micrarchaeota archaeon]